MIPNKLMHTYTSKYRGESKREREGTKKRGEEGRGDREQSREGEISIQIHLPAYLVGEGTLSSVEAMAGEAVEEDEEDEDDGVREVQHHSVT